MIILYLSFTPVVKISKIHEACRKCIEYSIDGQDISINMKCAENYLFMFYQALIHFKERNWRKNITILINVIFIFDVVFPNVAFMAPWLLSGSLYTVIPPINSHCRHKIRLMTLFNFPLSNILHKLFQILKQVIIFWNSSLVEIYCQMISLFGAEMG